MEVRFFARNNNKWHRPSDNSGYEASTFGFHPNAWYALTFHIRRSLDETVMRFYKDFEKEEQMNIESTFVQAAKNLNLCDLIDHRGNKRIVEPYMVYSSATNKRLFHCYQLQGYSKSGQPVGWKNPQVNSFAQAILRDETFTPRKEYNPFNYEMFPVVYFSIPTIDGRQR